MPNPVLNQDQQRQARGLAETLWPLLAPLFLDTSTYTPTYYGGTTAGVTTYTAQVGYWRRIGDVVHVWGTVGWSNATGTGNARISLPFTALNVTNYAAPVSLRLSGVTWTGSIAQGLIATNTNYIELEGVSSNAGPTKSAVETAGSVIFYTAYLTE